MKISVIKKLVEQTNFEELANAEINLLQEEPLGIHLEANDDSEILKYLFAATWIKEKIEGDDMSFENALTAYCQKFEINFDN